MSKVEIDKSKAQRAIAMAAITRTRTYIEKNAKILTHPQLETRLGLLENYFKQFLEMQDMVDFHNAEEPNSTENRREAYEEAFCHTKSKILSLMQVCKANEPGELHSQTSFSLPGPSHSHAPPLPKLELPKFTGIFTEWTNFYNTFKSIIDNDAEIHPIQKFQYLRQCLGNSDASMVIKQLEVTEANYKLALDLLKDRFDNKRIIYQAHIREISKLQKIQSNSASSLRTLLDLVNSHVRAMNNLGTKSDMAESFLLFMVGEKLDSNTIYRWEEEANQNTIPSWNDMSKFLQKRCKALESINIDKCDSRQQQQQTTNSAKPKAKTTMTGTVVQKTCNFCQEQGHWIYKCEKFNELSPAARYEAVMKLKLCYNCLKKGHSYDTCNGGSCTICKSKTHHSKLHCDETLSKLKSNVNVKTALSVQTFLKDEENKHVILATAVVLVKTVRGTFVECRVLLDSGSQLHFLTERFAQKTRLRRLNCDITVRGIAKHLVNIKHRLNITIKSRTTNYESNLEMLVIPRITEDQPEMELDTSQWPIPKNIVFADPQFNKPQQIDMLIGAARFFELLSVGQIKLGENLPILQKTVLGWIAAGEYSHNQLPSNCRYSSLQVVPNEHDTMSFEDEELKRILIKFWEIEHPNFEPQQQLTPEEMVCENHFKRYTKRDKTGRFIVRLPFKADTSVLGQSFENAYQQFLSLERRLSKNVDLKKQYVEFIEEYRQLNHMQLVDKHDSSKVKYVLPHHCVFKLDSSTTKLRVVFNASQKTSSGKSLNDIMCVGPTIQQDLYSILLRFRFHKYVLVADITKMYRQVLVDEADTYLQCILWRDHPDETIQTFRLKTVTYGTASASFLATRCLQQLATENETTLPAGAKVTMRDFYMDDMLTGADTLEEAANIRDEVMEILQFGGFELRKWASNNKELLQHIPAEHHEPLKQIGENHIMKTLGVGWEPTSDQFQFYYNFCGIDQPWTKRKVLSVIARMYDPLGLINPISIDARIFMQHLWLLNLKWDESLPQSYDTEWKAFYSQLPLVNNLILPRFVCASEGGEMEIHGFSDASTRAYGAAVYTRCISNDGTIHTHLVSAKSKVATLQTRSLAELELCGALLLSELITKIKPIIPATIKRIYCWSDSEIVLNWISAHPAHWCTFVAHRVTKIQEKTADCVWNHVRSKDNPADLCSRGTTPEKFLEATIWFSGPAFLQKSVEDWPKFEKGLCLEKMPGLRKTQTILTVNVVHNDLIAEQKFISNYRTMQRIFAYVIRFIENIRKSRNKETISTGLLTSSEIHDGTEAIVKIIQRARFPDVFESLQNKKPIMICQLSGLSLFVDKGVIRVGGRLRHSVQPYNQKHPMLLPKTHPFVSTLITHFHFSNFHAGPQAMLANIRLQFWIIGARDLARRTVKSCIKCFRFRPVIAKQIMGDLPESRVTPARPFYNAGVDLCGPVWIHYRIRGKKPTKAYIAVFVCFVTKAIHLEIVGNLSTESFLFALKRFIARRGKCKNLWCDNATNFVGCRRELDDLRQLFLTQQHQDAVQKACADDYVTIHHIPKRSPNFGGIWEAAVKSAKHLLYRMLNQSSLTLEELNTVIAQIESILNSRPITAMSSDPNDLQALTPGHFLIGEPLVSIPEPNVIDPPLKLHTRHDAIRDRYQHFWQRWQKEYLSELQRRVKWQTESHNVAPGTLVLLADENLPPQKWLMGRILSVHHGSDGRVRVVEVKTQSGTTTRAISKVAPLPLEHD